MTALLLRAAALLVLPLALLLFAQWPLRDVVQAGSREANDLAQVLFAVFMAVAVTAATRTGAHLSAAHGAPRRTRLRAWALLACVGPWAVFVLWSAWPQVAESLRAMERFPETLNPGYFLIKVALALLVLLVLVDALLAPLRKARRG